MGRYQLVVFDIDGTLIDTEKTGVLSLMRTVEQLMGREMPYEEAYGYFGIPSAAVAGHLGYSGKEDFAQRWEENFIALSHYITAFPGVDGLLAKVKDSGVLTGIVTSRSRFEFEYDKILARMVHLIDFPVCAEDTVRHKPYPDPLLECIGRASLATGGHIAASSCIFLGDTPHDWACAHEAGCDFALADWHGRGFQGIETDKKFSSADEALEILELSD